MDNLFTKIFESEFLYILGFLDVVALLVCAFGILIGKFGSILLNRAVTFRQGLTFVLLIIISVILIGFSLELIQQLMGTGGSP